MSAARSAVLAANEAFYRAFAAGDADSLEALIARETLVTTAHPWRPAAVGRDAVVAGWKAILDAGRKVLTSDRRHGATGYGLLLSDPTTMTPVAGAELCRQLQAQGVREFHFYTLNRAELTLAICRMLRAPIPITGVPRSAAAR